MPSPKTRSPLGTRSTPGRSRSYVTALSLVLCSALSLLPTRSVRAQAPADHVVLVSIDGFRPEFYQERERPAPTLQRMARGGVQADGVRGIFPSVTYPSHTTLVTGALPAAHGVYYNGVFDPEGETSGWYWDFDGITAETLWEAAGRRGLRTASIGWPVTVGAPIDYNLPEVWDPEGEWVAAVRRHTTPEGLFEEVEARATGAMSGDMLSGQHNAREDRVGAIAAYLLQEYRPHLLTVHLVSTDHAQHGHGRDHEEVDLAIAAVDRAVARMVEAADEAGILGRTAFVITGDHGFTNVSARVSPNVWLVEAGLLEARPDRGDWRAAFQTAGGSAFLELRDPDDAAAADAVRAYLRELPQATQRLFRVVEREELDAVGANPRTPLALAGSPIVTMSGSSSGDAVAPASGGMHGHFPDLEDMETGLVAWGAGVRPGVRVSQVGLEDVAPLVAALLGLRFEPADGMLVPGLLEGP